MSHVLLTGRRNNPRSRYEEIGKLGVGKLFGPGANIKEAIEYIRNWCKDNGHE